MPVKIHHPSERWYYQWGEHGKKYFFDPDNPEAKTMAKNKALRQGRAAFAHGYRGESCIVRPDVNKRGFFQDMQGDNC